MLRFRSLDHLRDLVGSEMPTGEWTTVEQSRIDAFADITEDHEWLHIDRERAREGPYGGTIAHGFLTLSLLPHLASKVYRFELPGQLVNYGLGGVRFPAPVPSGSNIRSRITPRGVQPHARGHRIILHHEIEIENRTRPACIADTIFFLLSREVSAP